MPGLYLADKYEFTEDYLKVYSTHILPTFIVQYLRIGAYKALSSLSITAEPVTHPGGYSTGIYLSRYSTTASIHSFWMALSF